MVAVHAGDADADRCFDFRSITAYFLALHQPIGCSPWTDTTTSHAWKLPAQCPLFLACYRGLGKQALQPLESLFSSTPSPFSLQYFLKMYKNTVIAVVVVAFLKHVAVQVLLVL